MIDQETLISAGKVLMFVVIVVICSWLAFDQDNFNRPDRPQLT